ncbi:peptidase [Phage C48C1]|nr:peptidase [Phage C48C1]
MAIAALTEQLQAQNQTFVKINESLTGISGALAELLKKEEEDKRRENEERDDQKKQEAAQKQGGKKGAFLGGLTGAGLIAGAKGFMGKALLGGGAFLGLGFFADIIADLVEEGLGSVEAGDITFRLMKGAAFGALFGVKGALIGAILGAFMTPEVKAELEELGTFLKESGIAPAIQSFLADTLRGALEGINALTKLDFEGVYDNLGSLALGIGGLFVALAPFKAASMAIGAVTGLVGILGGLLGKGGTPKMPAGAAGKSPGVLKRGFDALKSGAGKAAGVARAGLLSASLTAGAMTNGKVAQVAGAATEKVGQAAGAIKGAATEKVGQAAGAIKGAAKGSGKAIASGAAKMLGGTALKSIPIVGALAGIGFGMSSLLKGDPVAAGLHVASGLTSVIPGLGTAASVALSGAATAREMGVGKDSKDVSKAIAAMPTTGNKVTEAATTANGLKTQSPVVIMDNSQNSTVSGGGGTSIVTGNLSPFDTYDPYLVTRR